MKQKTAKRVSGKKQNLFIDKNRIKRFNKSNF